MSDDKEWYWDLNRKMAVHASERGPFEQVLGPYASKSDAENWKRVSEERNEDWEEADEAWKHGGDDEPPIAPI